MTPERIKEITKMGAERATADGFAVTPIQSRHVDRLTALKMTEHEEMLARVRVSDRFWCESDLYFRANRWSEDG